MQLKNVLVIVAFLSLVALEASAQTMFEAIAKMNATGGKRQSALQDKAKSEQDENDAIALRIDTVNDVNAIQGNPELKAELQQDIFDFQAGYYIMATNNLTDALQSTAQSEFDAGDTHWDVGVGHFYLGNYGGAITAFNAADPKFNNASSDWCNAQQQCWIVFNFFTGIQSQIP